MRAGFVVAAILPVLAGCSRGDPNAFVGFVDAPVSAVAAETAGQVESILAREGDTVKKGQLLATLESRERQAAVDVASANLDRARDSLTVAQANETATLPTVTGAAADIERAQAAVDDAETVYARTDKLVQGSAAPQSDLDTARSKLLQARASLASLVASKDAASGRVRASVAGVSDAKSAVRSAEAALELAKAQLAQTQVLAPFDGMIVDRSVEEGEWVAPGTPVLSVEDLSRMWVRLDVEETRFGSLAVGTPAEIRLVAVPGTVFHGKVAEVGAQADFAVNRDVKRGRPDIRTFRVRVAIDDASATLRPGMTAEVRLVPGAS
jgi:HlyD family secretion protein